MKEQWKLIDAYPGAHLRVKVGSYYHHGIYIGDDRVIQFGLPNGMLDKPEDVEVLNSPMKDFMGTSDFYEVRIYNHKEKKTKFSDEEIINNALKQVGNKGYNVLTNNCEHFANGCVFGIKTSNQIDNIYKDVSGLLKK